jgi:stalled ribosome rescue protein Dom34
VELQHEKTISNGTLTYAVKLETIDMNIILLHIIVVISMLKDESKQFRPKFRLVAGHRHTINLADVRKLSVYKVKYNEAASSFVQAAGL